MGIALRSRSRGPLLVGISLVLAAGSGCSLLTSLDGLSGSDGDAGAGEAQADSGTPSDAQVTSDAGDAADAPPDGAPAKYAFTDDFNRDSTGVIGNGWNEKVTAFKLIGNEVDRFAGSNDYRDSIVSRPSVEAVQDVAASIEFRFKVGGGGFVQLHARVQTSTLATPQGLDSYIVFRNLDVSDGRTFFVARQLGTPVFSVLGTFQTSSVIKTNAMYRLNLQVTGISPVAIAASVEMQDGATWSTIGSTTLTDSDPDRIKTAGVVGFSSGNDPTSTFAYDNFAAHGL